MKVFKHTFFLALIFSLVNDLSLIAKQRSTSKISLALQKKEKAIALYEKKSYKKASELIEEVLPLLEDKQEREQLQFYQAYCSYYDSDFLGENYEKSSNQFHLFIRQYPFSDRKEEAFFMRGYSLACKEVDMRVDQRVTYKAIGYVQAYIDAYPAGHYVDQAINALHKLEGRLIKKKFESAQFYLRLGMYASAVIALKNFEQLYPTSLFQENVLRLLINSYERLAQQVDMKEKKQEIMGYAYQYRKELAEYLNQRKKAPVANP